MSKLWIDADKELPPVGKYVNVLEDDNVNGQDLFFGRNLHKLTYQPQRVRPARLQAIDREGYGIWEGYNLNGYSMWEPKNVTYWQDLPDVPTELIKPEDQWP